MLKSLKKKFYKSNGCSKLRTEQCQEDISIDLLEL